MKKKKPEHPYLLSLYSKVDRYLTNNKANNDNIGDIIVSFCIVVEKILKIKLHKKSPTLVFDFSKMKESDALFQIIMKKEGSIETIKMEEVIYRIKLVYKDIFTDDELQALIEIYRIRNNFIHGYKPDIKIVFDNADIIKKLGTIWLKISTLAISLFGKEEIKKSIPKEKYSEDELEKVLIDEVRTKIMSKNRNAYSVFSPSYQNTAYPISDDLAVFSGYSSEKCPRCGAYGFSEEAQTPNWERLKTYTDYLSVNSLLLSGLYKCKKCHLELTSKEYLIAKNLK